MIEPLKIGNHTIDVPVFMAPMSGVSDRPFRSVVKRFGAGLTVSEMVSSNESIRATEGVSKKALGAVGEDIVYTQIIGSDAKCMADTARWCVDNGTDIIDINFGCPAKKLTGKYCGSALMRYPATMLHIMRTVKKSVSVPVTIKTRMGGDMACLNAPEVAHMAQSEGMEMVTIHGRTRNQRYTGDADWDFVKRVKDAVDIPVIVNGDIVDGVSALRALQASGADGVMVGRAVQGKPWILSHIMAYLQDGTHLENLSLEQQYKTLVHHYKAMLEYHGNHRGMLMARKHLSWYMAGMRGANHMRTKVMQMTDPEQVLMAIRDFYNQGQGA